jgi:serine/threonine protein kinase/Tol biopolymer transport system component
LKPERWAQIEELFHRAIECDGSERDLLLDQECNGDLDLRREVEALLSSDSSARFRVQDAVDSGVRDFGFSMVGEVVSHYRVLEALGGGGMGLVYRAEDMKLGRQVALKFLPEDLATIPSALARFEREARSASALEHPNICPIYEFGEHEGRAFLVMPLLEGRTLRDRIADRATPFTTDEVLDFAMQIASGLEAAHEKGIIHRDIKPANIFVTSRGEAKILDFGLAKLANDKGPEAMERETMSSMPARHLTLTGTGVTIGTAAYMSPEQVRGEKLDARTDLFSFGLVLYEMATGQETFSGKTAAVLQDAILHRNPVPAREINPALPPKVEAIINQALQKDRNARYHSAAKVLADLRDVRASRHATSLRRQWLVAAILVLLMAVPVAFWFTWRKPPTPAEIPELKQQELTANSAENAVSNGTISPDGKYLAYADLKGIHIKVIETGATTDVPQPEEFKGVRVNWGIVPTWLRDGTGFIADSDAPGWPRSVWAIPVTGERQPHKLRDDATAIAVSRDGSWIAFTTKPGLTGFDRETWLMKPDGSEARKLFELDENSGVVGAESSPDGRRLAYINHTGTQMDGRNILEDRDVRGGPAVTLAGDGITIADYSWSPDGRMIYSLQEDNSGPESCNYFAARIDLRTGKPLENPKRLTNWAGFSMDSTSITADGRRLAFRKTSRTGSVYLADLGSPRRRISNPKRLTLNEGRNYPATWTPDSKSVVFTSYRDGYWKILKQSPGQDAAELIVAGTIRDDWNAFPSLSPDGAWVIYLASQQSPLSSSPSSSMKTLMRVPIAGGRPEFVMTTQSDTGPECSRLPSTLCAVAESTPDRKQLIFTAFDPLRGRGRELLRFDTDPTTVDYIWDLSPDGTRIAILGYSEGRIHVLPVNGQAPRDVAIRGRSNLLSVNWAADGKSLFASSLTEDGSALLQVDLRGRAHLLWERKGSNGPWNAPWDGPSYRGWSGGLTATPRAVPSPDGNYLAIYDWSVNANMWMMENF